MATWSLINYQGKLAVTLGWSTDETPTETRPIWVSTEKWSDYYNRYSQVSLTENNIFRCFNHNTYQTHILNTNGWEMVNETRPIKPPSRGGKDWKWEWSGWSRKYIKSYI